jgi:hypothetical protein
MAASINLKIDTNFAQASADLKAFGNVSEAQAKKIENYVKSFKSEQLDAFEQRQKRTSAAIKATRGPVAALTSDYKAYQRRIEQLIRNGLDPESDEVQRLVKEYKKLSKEIDDATAAENKHKKASALNAASMVFLAGQAINVAEKIFDMGKVFIDAGSDAEETQNKFDVVFQGIEADAVDATEALATGFGLSQQAAQDLLAGTGDLLVGFGFTRDAALELSTDVQDLAGDLASFQNLETADVSDRITKALTGETESLKALGVVIRQDTKEYKDRIAAVMEAENVSITQAKSLVNLAIITEQSANAIGDFERSQDSFANQSKITQAAVEDFKVALGDALLPAATTAVTIFGDLTTKVTGFLTRTLQAWKAQRDLNKALKGEGTDLESAQQAYEEVSDKLENLNAQYEFANRELSDYAKSIPSVVSQNEGLKNSLADEIEKRKEQLVEIQNNIDKLLEEESIKAASVEITNAQVEAIGEETEKIKENAEWTREAAEARAKAWSEAYEAEIQTLADRRSANEQYNSEQLAAYDEMKEAQIAASEEAAEAVEANFNAIASVASSVWSSLTSMSDAYYTSQLSQYDKDSEEYKKLQLEQFNVNKAASAVNAGIAGAAGAVEAYKALAGIPVVGPGLGIAAAGAMGIFTAAQVGFILSQQPSFQTGTLPSGFTVPESTSTRGDNQTIAVNPGETVNVTPRGGGSASSPMTVNVMLDSDIIFSKMQEGIDSGQVVVSSANIVQRAV